MVWYGNVGVWWRVTHAPVELYRKGNRPYYSHVIESVYINQVAASGFESNANMGGGDGLVRRLGRPPWRRHGRSAARMAAACMAAAHGWHGRRRHGRRRRDGRQRHGTGGGGAWAPWATRGGLAVAAHYRVGGGMGDRRMGRHERRQI